MKDRWGREIEYLRISITESCNLCCRYCMPDGPCKTKNSLLSYDEIEEVVRAGAGLGIKYIKVTGGEPLVRKDCDQLIRRLKKVSGIEKVTLTTNGQLLTEQIERLKAAGVDGINISLDTMNPAAYKELTGYDGLSKVLEGIEAGLLSTIPIKVNCVAFKGHSDWKTVLLLARDRKLDVRFIEVMPLGQGKNFESEDCLQILEEIKNIYPGTTRDERKHGQGPAVYYQIPGFSGSVGVISALHGPFCQSCNRLRVTSAGFLKTCLCYNDGINLRPFLGKKDGMAALRATIKKVVWDKPKAHCFDQPEKITESHKMGEIGG